MARKPDSSKTREASWYVGNNGEKQSGQGQTPWKPARFVRCELTDAEKAHCKAQAWKPDEVFSVLGDILTEGYKVTVVWEKANECYGAWLICTLEEHRHSGFILSARGPSLLAAMAVLMYKHFTKLDAQWPTEETQGPRDQWG